MSEIHGSRFLNPDGDSQIYEDGGIQNFNYDEWGLSERAHAELIKDEATICLPPNSAPQAHRFLYPIRLERGGSRSCEPSSSGGRKRQLFLVYSSN